MLGAMPCGKDVVVHWSRTAGEVDRFAEALQLNRWFGFAEMELEFPKLLTSQSSKKCCP